MIFPRRSGLLLHPSSLPSPYGIGELGPAAYRFIDFLNEAGQAYWQILPLTPTDTSNSPYQCLSAFAGNPMLISLDLLHREGYLSNEIISKAVDFNAGRVIFDKVKQQKNPIYFGYLFENSSKHLIILIVNFKFNNLFIKIKNT